MNGLEALEEIKDDMEYVTRLDFVEPIVRGEVKKNLFKIYHRELPQLDLIEKELKDGAKYKKAIEILNGKGTYMVEIISAVCYYKTYDELLADACPRCSTKDLNREEFNLLKEVLK